MEIPEIIEKTKKLNDEIKNAPGKHDQAEHGRWAAGRDSTYAGTEWEAEQRRYREESRGSTYAGTVWEKETADLDDKDSPANATPQGSTTAAPSPHGEFAKDVYTSYDRDSKQLKASVRGDWNGDYVRVNGVTRKELATIVADDNGLTIKIGDKQVSLTPHDAEKVIGWFKTHYS